MLFPTDWQTVRLVVSVPHDMPHGGWEWALHPQGNPVGTEFVYNCEELRWTFRVWGKVVGTVLIGAAYDRYNVSAYGMLSGNLLGRATYERSAETGRFVANGDPWCTWEQARFPADLTNAVPIRVARCCSGTGFDRAA